MPIQIFPPQPHLPKRNHTKVSRFLRPLLWLVLAGCLLLLAVTALPYVLLNTQLGRDVLLALANRTEEAHLALRSASASLPPEAAMKLEGLKLSQPFEPEAPKLSIELLNLAGFRLVKEEQGTILVAAEATLQDVSLEAHQRWVQQQQAGRKPPALPPQLPSELWVETFTVQGLSYRVHQLRRGMPTTTVMKGVSARFTPLRWDLKAMKASGSGRMHAETLSLNGMTLTDLAIPELALNGDVIRIPAGTAQGLGGALSISGLLNLKSGIPLPRLHVKGRGLSLTQVIEAAPDARRDRPAPTGTLSIDIDLSTVGNADAGEVPEPVITGTILLESLQVPVAEKSPLAQKVLERSPLWVGGSPPRLQLGDMIASIRVADGRVELRQARLTLGDLTLLMEGTIDQNTDALNLRLKMAPRGSGQAGTVSALLPAAQGAEAPTLPPAEADTTNTAPETHTASSTSLDSSTSATSLTPMPSTLPTAPSGPGAFFMASREKLRRHAEDARDDLAARTQTAKAKAEEARSRLDATAQELKRKLDQDLASAQLEHLNRQAALKAAADHGPEALKAHLDARVLELKEGIQEDLQSRMARVQARINDIGQKALNRFSPQLEHLELCISGTTSHPVVKLCQE